ncbi:MAG TPA: lytic transglycosylase domain-containing protein [Candidatus Polarisedimenticolia bacterium]|jgi:soluble lytic murein transglycosylase-like protein|nr:lytic transglycosylase domain-containing protein [Candidatus Polarisedimenticolia bacterium]
MTKLTHVNGLIVLACCGVLVAVCPSPCAAAHQVTFLGGGTLDVETFRVEGSRIILTLHGGGEIGFPAHQVAAIAARTTPAPAPAAVSPAPTAAAHEPAPVDRSAAAPDLPPISPWDPEPGVRILIRHVAGLVGVDAKLVEAVVETESKFDPYAVSRRGAMGLMQLMPRTALRFQVRDVFDPRQNLEGGTRYLKELLLRYQDTALALAAYNAGEEAVDRYRGIPPYRETRGYVSRILGRLKS